MDIRIAGLDLVLVQNGHACLYLAAPVHAVGDASNGGAGNICKGLSTRNTWPLIDLHTHVQNNTNIHNANTLLFQLLRPADLDLVWATDHFGIVEHDDPGGREIAAPYPEWRGSP